MPTLTIEGKKYLVGNLAGESSFWKIPVDRETITIEILREIPGNPTTLLIRAGSRVVRVSAIKQSDKDAYSVELDGRPMVARLEEETLSASPVGRVDEGPLLVSSPMAGKIAAVKTSVGASVEEGQALIILEAMKMENEITAPRKGSVKEVYVEQGALAKPGDKLVLIE